jgi:copper chaperone NosL
MKPFLVKSHRILQAPLGAGPRALLVLAALLLVLTYLLPLWDMTMFAPQYGNGLRLHIYSHELVGGNGGQDLKEINLLNHYIGMHELSEQSFTEFLWMPFIIGALGLLFLRAAVFGTIGHLVDVTVMFVYFGLFSLYSFAHKLWVYGHELAPDAAVKVPGFMPPAIGGKQIANFEVYSYPGLASWALAGTGLALVLAVSLGARAARRARLAAEAAGAGPRAGPAGG